MTSIRKAALACVASAVVMLPLSAGAQTPRNQDTFFTFSQSVELPGTTLPAGRYFFQLVDSASNRHIVRVMSEDKKQVHTTLMAIPYHSNDRPPDEPQVRFMETPSGANATNAIKIWFYPGRTTGHEFIYPRSQAMRIASRTGESVLTTKTETEVTQTVADSELTRVDRTGQEAAVDLDEQTPDETQQPEPAPAPATDTQAAQAPQPATDRTDSTDRDTARTDLPETASLLPLLALIGVGSLVGSRLLRRS